MKYGKPEENKLDGTYESIVSNGINVHVKTCIKPEKDTLTIKVGGLLVKSLYVTGASKY